MFLLDLDPQGEAPSTKQKSDVGNAVILDGSVVLGNCVITRNFDIYGLLQLLKP